MGADTNWDMAMLNCGLLPAFVIQSSMLLKLSVFSTVILGSAVLCFALLTYSPVPLHKEVLSSPVVVVYNSLRPFSFISSLTTYELQTS